MAVSRSSDERALRRRDLLVPVRYEAERRQLAVARRALFVVAPTRRNRVWQTDFTEYARRGHAEHESVERMFWSGREETSHP